FLTNSGIPGYHRRTPTVVCLSIEYRPASAGPKASAGRFLNRFQEHAKTMTFTALKLTSALALGAALIAGPAAAQYPERAVNMVVPFSAGGPTDTVARSLAEAMRPTLGETVVVENKGGAGGTIGVSHVARSKPDGHTILLMHIGFSTAQSLYKDPGYTSESFDPIGLVLDVPMTIIAR